MGYELHIERVGAGRSEIDRMEWDELVASDPSLTRSGDGSCFWTEHPFGGIQGGPVRLTLSRGRISTKAPDEFVTLKLFELAGRLQALVRDDEGPLDADDRKDLEQQAARILARRGRDKAWWRFW